MLAYSEYWPNSIPIFLLLGSVRHVLGISLWAKLPGAKHAMGETVFGRKFIGRNYRERNLSWAKQSLGENVLGETTGSETVVGRNSRWAKMYWAKLPGAKQSLGETVLGETRLGETT